jgi:hypothetical protein
MTAQIKISYHAPDGSGVYHDWFRRWQKEVIFDNYEFLPNTVYIQKLNSELGKIGALYFIRDSQAYLSFKHKEDAMDFILRWS